MPDLIKRLDHFKLPVSRAGYKLFCMCVLLLWSPSAFAHSINYALEKAPVQDAVRFYFTSGITHIIPQGVDHILFVVALCLLNNRIKTILWQATAFTVAHSITLALSLKGVITLPSEVVEPIIALSIVFVAAENMLLDKLKPWRVVLVFLFGLVHGLGFASALNEVGLPRDKFFTSVLSFNAGVEIAQVSIIALVFPMVHRWGNKPWYKKTVVYPLSVLIGLIAACWMFQRLFVTAY